MCSNRSLNTLEEIWTGFESTIFPYSTTNERDFYNLMSIYLESIFNPLNKKVDFLMGQSSINSFYLLAHTGKSGKQ